MNYNVGLWIDHQRAVIVSETEDGVTTSILESHVDAHPRYSGSRGDRGEKKYEQRHDEQLDRYYDDIIDRLGRPRGLFIFGPGEAMLELKERLARSGAIPESVVATESSDKLTDRQIVATVKEHFKVA